MIKILKFYDFITEKKEKNVTPEHNRKKKQKFDRYSNPDAGKSFDDKMKIRDKEQKRLVKKLGGNA